MNGKLSERELVALRASVGCDVLIAGHPDYDSVRRVWNGMIDRMPSVAVRPSSIVEVMQVVRFAREMRIPVTVKSGGHSVSGKSVADGALLIDLSLMRGIQVDAARRTALVQGGATWGELDREAERYLLATTGGVISSTGVAGLTLGGG